jgi:hypothetical protein
MARRTNSYMLAVMGLLAAASAAVPAVPVANAQSPEVAVGTEGGFRTIRGNGIPGHATGRFSNRGNPNRISEQDYAFRVPLGPRPAGRRTPLGHHNFGVALNGVPFDPGTAEYWRGDRRAGWRYEALSGKIDLGIDSSNAHVQPNGAYHYHGLPRGLMTHVSADRHSPLIGYAADGFPIYALYGYADPKDPSKGVKQMRSSWRLKPGQRDSANGPGGRYDGTFDRDWQFVPCAGDLDESNARFAATPDYPGGTWAYFLTEGYPWIPRSFVGTPDDSFLKGPPGGRRGGPGGPGMGMGMHGPDGHPPHDHPPHGGPPPFGGPPPWDRR